MIIDVHVHIRTLKDIGRAFRQAEQLDMVLCVNSINLDGGSSPNYPAQWLVTACNDQTERVVDAHPERAIPMWYLNPAHGDAACRELERRVTGHGGPQGVKLWTAVRGNDPRLAPIMAICAERQLPVLQHTFMEITGTLPGETTAPDMREMALRYPDVTFFWGHASGDWEFGAKCARGVPNVLLDVGGCEARGEYTQVLLDHVGADHIVYGSDGTGRSFASQIAKAHEPGISSEDRHKILFANARRAFAGQPPGRVRHFAAIHRDSRG